LWFSGLLHHVWWWDTNPEDGGSAIFQNTGKQPPHYMAQQPRKQNTNSVFPVLCFNVLRSSDSYALEL